MKITFLGTAHGMPNPERNRQSILIELGGAAYLFDAGAPVLPLLQNRNYDLSKIKVIFISHSHGDHISNLPNLITSEQVHANVFLPEENLVLRYEKDYHVQASLIQKGRLYHDEHCTVTAFSTTHLTDDFGNSLSNGFLIEAEGKKVHITGDYNIKDFPHYAYDTPIDLLISECAHFAPDALFSECAKCQLGAVAILHVYPAERYDLLSKQQSLLPYPLLLPNDGDDFVL